MLMSLNAGISPVWFTWPPRQRSVNWPCVHCVMAPSSRSASRSSLKGWSCQRSSASSRVMAAIWKGSRRPIDLRMRQPQPLQVLLRERARQPEVVVEAGGRGWTDAELGLRHQLDHRLGEHVRGGVAHARQAILLREVGKVDVGFDRVWHGWDSPGRSRASQGRRAGRGPTLIPRANSCAGSLWPLTGPIVRAYPRGIRAQARGWCSPPGRRACSHGAALCGWRATRPGRRRSCLRLSAFEYSHRCGRVEGAQTALAMSQTMRAAAAATTTGRSQPTPAPAGL